MSLPKAQAEIVTTVVLVVVMVGVILFFTTVEGSRLMIDITQADEVASVKAADHAKRMLFSCFGYPLPYNLTYKGCNIPFEQGVGSVKGIVLEQFDFGSCTNRTIINRTPESYSDVVTYLVPVQVNNTNCPGNLKVFI